MYVLRKIRFSEDCSVYIRETYPPNDIKEDIKQYMNMYAQIKRKDGQTFH